MKIIGDKPLSSTGLFNFDIYGETLANIIIGENTDTPLGIGIFGDLGSGRTSIMNVIMHKIKLNDPEIKIILFNAHEQSIAGNTLSGPSLLYYIYHELGGKKTKSNQLEKLGKSLLEIAGEVGARKFLGLTLGEVKSKFEAEAISRYYLAENFKLAVNEYLNRENYKRIVVFIDDIDICHPETAIGILESIKFFLRTEGCIFVLGMDKKIISEYYQAYYSYFFKYIEMKTTISDYFLEKIIQLEFYIPPPSNEKINEFINISIIPDFYKTSPYIDMIIRGVGNNPRKLKLLFNIMELQQRLIESIPELQREITDEQNKKRFMGLLLEWAIISSYYSDFRKEVEEKKWILHEFHEYLGFKLLENPDLVMSELSDIPGELQHYWQKSQPILELIKAFHKEITEIPTFDEIERVIHLSSVASIKVEETEEKVKKEEILERSQVIVKLLNKESMKGAILRNQDLKGLTLRGIDLSYSNLTGVLLNETKIENTKLNSAKLIGAVLSRAIISDTVMSGADMSSANLSEADLYRVSLRNVTMEKTYLRNAKLRHCNLENARFDNETDFTGADFDWFTLNHLKGSNWNEALWDPILLEKIRKEYV